MNLTRNRTLAQMDGALPCTIGCVGDAFEVSIVLQESYVLAGVRGRARMLLT